MSETGPAQPADPPERATGSAAGTPATPNSTPAPSGPPPRNGVAFESWIDAQIREATARGVFDNLPGAGKPLNLPRQDDENWWLKGLIEREKLGEAALPPSLLLKRQKENLQQALADVTSEVEARRIVDDLNDRIRQSHRFPLPGPPAFVATVDVDAELATWRQARGR